MRRVVHLIGLCAVAATMAVAIGPRAVRAEEEQPVDRKHLDWDQYDRVWRCVGSPLNCEF